MPYPKREQHRIDLTVAERQRLDDLAKQTLSRPERGKDAYQFDWKALIKRIAAGDFDITERNPYKLPPGLDAAIERNEAKEQRQAAKVMKKWKQSSLLETVN